MAQSKDGTKRRTVIIAVDGSDNSKAAFQDCRAYMETKRLAKESEPAISYTADRLKDLNSIFEEAIVYAKLVHRKGDRVLFIFVQHEKPYEPWPKSSNYHDDWEGIVKFMRDQEEYVVNEYESECLNYKFDFEPVMVEIGNPGPVICDVAKSEEADLLVLGSHGRGTIRRTLMGSVCTYCVHHAHLPVLVVPNAVRHKLCGHNNKPAKT